jgi:hypothetical protein
VYGGSLDWLGACCLATRRSGKFQGNITVAFTVCSKSLYGILMTHHIVVEHTIIQIRTLVTYMILQFVHCVSYFESDYYPNSINQLIVVMRLLFYLRYGLNLHVRGL